MFITALEKICRSPVLNFMIRIILWLLQGVSSFFSLIQIIDQNGDENKEYQNNDKCRDKCSERCKDQGYHGWCFKWILRYESAQSHPVRKPVAMSPIQLIQMGISQSLIKTDALEMILSKCITATAPKMVPVIRRAILRDFIFYFLSYKVNHEKKFFQWFCCMILEGRRIKILWKKNIQGILRSWRGLWRMGAKEIYYFFLYYYPLRI